MWLKFVQLWTVIHSAHHWLVDSLQWVTWIVIFNLFFWYIRILRVIDHVLQLATGRFPSVGQLETIPQIVGAECKARFERRTLLKMTYFFTLAGGGRTGSNFVHDSDFIILRRARDAHWTSGRLPITSTETSGSNIPGERCVSVDSGVWCSDWVVRRRESFLARPGDCCVDVLVPGDDDAVWTV